MKRPITTLLLFAALFLIGCSATSLSSANTHTEAVPKDSTVQSLITQDDIVNARKNNPDNEAFRQENIEPIEVPEGIPVILPQ